MQGKVFATDAYFWAVIRDDNGRTFTAMHSACDQAVYRTLRRDSPVTFDVVQVDGRDVVRNLQLADSITASINKGVA